MIHLLAAVLLMADAQSQEERIAVLHESAPKQYGLRGCDGTGMFLADFCVSVKAANRSGTAHGDLTPACATSGAAGPELLPATEIAFKITKGTVADLAFQLGCLLKLPVEAEAALGGIELTGVFWASVLVSCPSTPFIAANGQRLWLRPDFVAGTIKIAGQP
jgi:hypothetical protein